MTMTIQNRADGKPSELSGRCGAMLQETIDSLYATFPDRLRPLLPCATTGFDTLTAWVERGKRPPASRDVPRPTGTDLLAECTLR